MNGPAPEGLGQVLGSLFKARGSHLQHNGLRTAPEARLPFRKPSRGTDGDSSATAGIFAPHPQREIRGLKLS